MKSLAGSAIFILATCAAILPAKAAQPDAFVNIRESPTRLEQPAFRPGEIVILPGGGQAVIEQALPDGRWRASGGIEFSPEGIIRTGPWAGQAVIRASGGSSSNSDVNVHTPINIDLGGAKEVPGAKNTPPATPLQTPPVTIMDPVPYAGPEEPAEAEQPLTLGQLLPVTPIGNEGDKKKSMDMIIPKNAKDLSFLEGKWKCRKGNIVLLETGEPMQEILTFNRDGTGTAVVRKDGNVCQGSLRANLRKGKLHVDIGKQKCTHDNPDSIRGTTMICRPGKAGAPALCKKKNHLGTVWDVKYYRTQ